MLDTERLDVVQVWPAAIAFRTGRGSAWNTGCRSWRRSRWRWTCPRWKGYSSSPERRSWRSFRCTRCGAIPSWRRCGRAVRGGEIGEPLLSFSQKTYKWGNDRPDAYRSRKTFPGIAPWVGIHAFDWLHAILGDVFTSVQGCEGATARPDYPACASQAAFVLTMKNGGVAAVTLDYLRPESAPPTATSGCGSRGHAGSSRPHSSIGR